MAVARASTEYNPYSSETQHNPYPVYRWLRDEAPVYHNPDIGFWALSRFDDVMNASLDPGLYVSGHGMTIEGLDVGQDILINKDEPEHTWHRRLVSRVFTPTRVAAQEPSIRHVCRTLLEGARDAGSMDVVEDFSLKLPMAVICEMLGLPEESREPIHKLSERILTTQIVSENPVPPDDAMNAFIELFMLLLEVVTERAASPGRDIISLLLESEVADDDGKTWKLTHEQVASRVLELATAGHETTAKLIANGVIALAWYPDQRAALAADPSLIPNAVEEIVRWDGASHYQGRWIEREVELHGVTIPADSRVILVTAAANHDDRVFENPELFNIRRELPRHVGFGWGIHLCLGHALARLETRVAIEEFLRHYPEYELGSIGVRRAQSGQVRGLSNLPIAFATSSEVDPET
jgi:cytochrome P450